MKDLNHACDDCENNDDIFILCNIGLNGQSIWLCETIISLRIKTSNANISYSASCPAIQD